MNDVRHVCTVLGFALRTKVVRAQGEEETLPAEYPVGLRRVPHICRLLDRSCSTPCAAVSEKLSLPYFYVTSNNQCCYGQHHPAGIGTGEGPSIAKSATGQSPVWRLKTEHHTTTHLVLMWNLPAHYVEVFGTFTQPPWSRGLPMWWCPVSRCHWIDLHETVPGLSGLMQFKFVADGSWKCDPNYPICDDGSPSHSLNNVCVIFPQRLRLRLSNQRLRRRQSVSSNRLNTTRLSTSWVCGVNSPKQATPRHGRQLIRNEDDKSRPRRANIAREASTAQPNELCSKPAWARFEAAGTPLSSSPTTKAFEEKRAGKRSPTISGTGAATSQACRRWLIRQAQQEQDGREDYRAAGLLGSEVSTSATSVAADEVADLKTDLSRTGAHTGTATTHSMTTGGTTGGSSDGMSLDGATLGEMQVANVGQQVATVGQQVARVGQQVATVGQQVATVREQAATVGHQVATVGQQVATVGQQVATVGQQVATVGQQVATVGQQVATVGQRSSRNEARRREKQKHLDTLVRCLSHHGGRRQQKSGIDKRRSRVANWPSYVTSLLHDPDVMLELFDLPKVLKLTNEYLCLRAGWSMTTHPEKRMTGGADSFYVSRDGRVLALADGVGAWEQLGVNSRAYADELVTAIKDVWEDAYHSIHSLHLKPSLLARELMTLAAKAPVSYGSATCTIAVFDPMRQELGICNLGDSGVSLLRRNNKGHITPYFRTPEMTHFFNCPFQLSKTPSRKVIEKILGLKNIENGKGFVLPAQDAPKHAHCFDLRVEEGDLLLMASDGLWDNLWPWEISSLCTLTLTPLEALILHDDTLLTEGTDIARALTEAASWKSQDPRSSTPFAKNYTAECGMPGFTGGKWDDITVIAAWVARHHISTTEIYGYDGELIAKASPLQSVNTPHVRLHPTHPERYAANIPECNGLTMYFWLDMIGGHGHLLAVASLGCRPCDY
ncbi:putative protein phosphatase 2C [Gregarina niphandrodes]|uniref:PPM-type phosphatase domain-containing protein n=1 Tax=Gregarina niphandrodes TaxID=110365 RepID=A0A023BBV7_GRENI|nr:putative protein phosphatase 2C [Gregarina niphandrodes]EZG81164.1 putative protein phosphatase 2C [Gregarina niphandrodes]|eukprot:XP_011134260.1 putative protein phosphatase 2C [Gregarina niphandrodes]